MLVNAHTVVARVLSLLYPRRRIRRHWTFLSLPISTSQSEPYYGCVRHFFLVPRAGITVDTSYWAKELDSLNPNFGTAGCLKELSNALHGRGMYLIHLEKPHMLIEVNLASLTEINAYSHFNTKQFTPR